MSPKIKKDQQTATFKKLFEVETLEEAEKMVVEKVEPKYQKGLLEAIRKAFENKPDKDSGVKRYNFTRTEESNQTDKYINILRTPTATLIVPVLMHAPGNIDISLEVSTQEENKYSMVNNTPIAIESDIKGDEGVVPLLVIPHTCEGNDNEAAIAQIIDFLLKNFSDSVRVDHYENTTTDVSMKLVCIK